MKSIPKDQPRTGVRHEDRTADMRELWNLLQRNRWLLIGSLLATITGAILVTRWTVPTYEAATTIRIDERRATLGMLDVLGGFAGGSDVATEMEVLRSRTLAESIVDSLGLQVGLLEPRRISRSEIIEKVQVSRTAPEEIYRFEQTENGWFRVTRDTDGVELGQYAPGETIPLSGARIVLAPKALEFSNLVLEVVRFEKAVETLREGLNISRPNREADIVVVRYQSRDSILVHEVPNLLARSFVVQRNRLKNTETSSTIAFLQEQIASLADQLIAAETELQRFRETSQVVSLEAEASAQVRELAELEAQRNALNAEREALHMLLEEVRRESETATEGAPSPYRRLIAFHSLLRNQAASEILRSLSVVENERAELLKRRSHLDPDVRILNRRVAELEEQLRSLATTYLQGITNQVEALDATLTRFSRQLEAIPAKEIQLARLERQRAVLAEIHTLLQTRLKEAEIAHAVEDASVQIVDPAIRPVEPIKPILVLNLAIGLMLGLVLGVGGALVREFSDTTVHSREELQQLTGVSVLGVIPRIPAAALNGNGRRLQPRFRTPVDLHASLRSRLIASNDPRSPISEAYRSLRTNITFSRLGNPPKLIVFTSPTPGDGKSTTSANLAITLAQQGLKVLLVDADMRRGSLNTVFGVDREPGLSNVLLGTVTSAEAIRSVQIAESVSLDFLSTGTLPPTPAELLGSQQMRDLLLEFEKDYDFVILDAPPLNLVTDAALLGTNADGVVVVARAGMTQKGAIEVAMDHLRHVRAPLLGAVLNDFDHERNGKYYGKYGAYYGHYQAYFMDES